MLRFRSERWLHLTRLEEQGRDYTEYSIIGYINDFDFI